VRELFGALAALDDTLRIVAVGTPPGTVVPPRVERTPMPATIPTNFGWMVSGLPRAARKARLDLFHAPSYTAPVYGPRPLVLTIHDVSYARHPEWYPYKRDPLRRAFYRFSARTADRIITDSRFSRDEIATAYGLSPDRIDVIPLAPAGAFTPGPRLTLPANWPDRFVLHVGDLHVRRNLPMLAHAVATLRGRDPACKDLALVLVGVDRGLGPTLQDIDARAGGRSPLVLFAGDTSETMLIALYRSAAALVYPSRYEGFGLPLLEAMACGTPVIAARTSSIPEVVGDAAVLLDPDEEPAWVDAIRRVLEDPAHAAQLAAAGVHRAAAFSWQRTAAETARVYRSLLTDA
jgi:glycosyltransferase involved in cell wall biosynthesis